jgi:hypothetical protein
LKHFEDIDFIHFSFVGMLEVGCLEARVDLKASEVLELIHNKEGYPECEETMCKYQREKPNEPVFSDKVKENKLQREYQ